MNYVSTSARPFLLPIMSPVLLLPPSAVSPQAVSTSTSRGSYIVSLSATPSASYAALAPNNTEGNAIFIYSLASSGLSRIKTLSIPEGSNPTSMRTVENFGGRKALLSAHAGPGSIRVWDERTGTPVVESQSIDYFSCCIRVCEPE